MEEPKLNEEKKQEVTLVKKGLFYYIFQLILLPFRIIIWLCRFAWKYISIYIGWYKEYIIYKERKKNLNKVLAANKLGDEIL